jgi:hypothetical protein
VEFATFKIPRTHLNGDFRCDDIGRGIKGKFIQESGIMNENIHVIIYESTIERGKERAWGDSNPRPMGPFPGHHEGGRVKSPLL